jgi:hypothetical protein
MGIVTEQERLFNKFKWISDGIQDLKYIIQNSIDDFPLTKEAIQDWRDLSESLLEELHCVCDDTLAFIQENNVNKG